MLGCGVTCQKSRLLLVVGRFLPHTSGTVAAVTGQALEVALGLLS
jgi:hypothetical protein